MKLRTAAAVFFVLIFGLFAALSVSLVRTAELLDRSATEVALAGESIRLAEELKGDLLTHNRNVFLYSLTSDPSRMGRRGAQRAKILELVATMELLTAHEGEGQLLAQLKQAISDYLRKRDELRAAGLPATEQYSQISGYVDVAIAIIEELIEINRQQMNELVAVINERNNVAEFVAGLLLAIGGLTLLAVTAAGFYFITRPLARLARVVDEYGAGDSTERAEARGVAEIKHIAWNFNAMADRLEERRQDQLRFVASIAHDLRNPLNSISLVSEMLVHKSGSKDKELASVVLRQVRNLDQLVQDLLDVSRIEAGKLELHIDWHELAAIVRDAVELHRAGTVLHEWQVGLPEEPIQCRCDRIRLSQVLNNLLSNAIKYSPNGGLISVRARAEQGQIIIEVSDQGIGVQPEDVDKIFKPFQRSAATRHTIPGIGLGLAASRRIIEAHGGSLTVSGTAGEGAVFRIALPCQPDQPQALRLAETV